MHVIELSVNHAAGFVKRSKNKCENFRHGIESMVQWIGNNKAKDRYDKYAAHILDTAGINAIRVPVPNKTRVAGT
jgi:hypothetical protein